jgi:hypothetical protein
MSVFVKAETYTGNTPEDKLKEVRATVKGAFSNVTSVGFNGSKDNISTTLPSVLDKPTRFVFRISEGDIINLERFILLILVSLLFFIILYSSIKDFSTFSSGASLIIALGLTAILSITGTANLVSSNLNNMTQHVSLLEKIGQWTIAIWALIFVALLVANKWIANKIKKKIKINKAKERGREIGQNLDVINRTGEGISEVINEMNKE